MQTISAVLFALASLSLSGCDMSSSLQSEEASLARPYEAFCQECGVDTDYCSCDPLCTPNVDCCVNVKTVCTDDEE